MSKNTRIRVILLMYINLGVSLYLAYFYLLTLFTTKSPSPLGDPGKSMHRVVAWVMLPPSWSGQHRQCWPPADQDNMGNANRQLITTTPAFLTMNCLRYWLEDPGKSEHRSMAQVMPAASWSWRHGQCRLPADTNNMGISDHDLFQILTVG